MSNVSQWLRRAGIKTPYADLTEAQLDEKNKQSPLSGYGFMSASDKAQKAQQQALFQQQMQYEQEMQQQQLLARMSSQGQIGHHVGSGIMGMLDALRNKGQAPQATPSPQDDPEVSQYNQYMSEGLPDDVAMEMVGQQSGNGAMIRDALENRGKRQKKELDLENVRGQIDERKRKPNPTITVQKTGPNGEPMQASVEVIGKDSQNNNIYRELGSAVKGSVTDTSEGWGLSKSQKGKQLTDFEGQMTSAENYLDVSDRIGAIADKAQAGPGFALSLAGQANNLRFGFETIKKTMSSQLDAKAKAKLASEDPVARYQTVFDNIEDAAGWDANLKALLLEQAYLKATANGQRATDADVSNALKTIGGSLNDPKIFKQVIQQDRELTVDHLMNASKNSGGPNKSLSDVYSDRLKGIQDRRNPKKASKVRVIGPNGKVKMVPGDDPRLKSLPKGWQVSE